MSEEINYTIPTVLDGAWVALRRKSTPEPKLGYLTTQRIGEAVFLRLDVPNRAGVTTPEVFPIDDLRDIVLSDRDRVLALLEKGS